MAMPVDTERGLRTALGGLLAGLFAWLGPGDVTHRWLHHSPVQGALGQNCCHGRRSDGPIHYCADRWRSHHTGYVRLGMFLTIAGIAWCLSAVTVRARARRVQE